MKQKTTYDQTCPHCNRKITDLWDHDWHGTNYIEIACPHCGREIEVTAETSYIITGQTTTTCG